MARCCGLIVGVTCGFVLDFMLVWVVLLEFIFVGLFYDLDSFLVTVIFVWITS